MPTDIKLKNSVTATNAPTSLQQGEVAINITDKKMWVGNAATTPVQLLGDGGSGSFTSIAFGDGTASAPSITNIGDTNTGIFFPAADTIAFTEGGVESMRITDAGNVGIGTSSPVTIASTTALSVYNSNTASIYMQNSSTGITGNDGFSLAINGTDAFINNREAGNLITFVNSAERMRIDSSGNLLVGSTSTPSGSGVNLQIANATAARLWLTATGTRSFYIESSTGNALQFVDATAGAERMRIDSSGNLLLGRTNNPNSLRLAVAGGNASFYDANDGQAVFFIQNKGIGTAGSGAFGLSYNTVNYTPGAGASNIYWDGSSGWFTLSTSSRKYKRNIQDVTNEQLNKALQLQPSYYQRLEYDYWEYGFIAEQVQEIGLDEFVTKVEGEVSGLNYEKMVTLAFGLIQRQQKQIDDLTTRLNALEGK